MTEYAVIDGQRVALTDWFPAEVKPVHEGAYEASFSGQPSQMLTWKDSRWFGWHGRMMFYQERKWRGLSHPPGAT